MAGLLVSRNRLAAGSTPSASLQARLLRPGQGAAEYPACFRSGHPPGRLLVGCTNPGGCRCTFQHHDDRRAGPRRSGLRAPIRDDWSTDGNRTPARPADAAPTPPTSDLPLRQAQRDLQRPMIGAHVGTDFMPGDTPAPRAPARDRSATRAARIPPARWVATPRRRMRPAILNQPRAARTPVRTASGLRSPSRIVASGWVSESRSRLLQRPVAPNLQSRQHRPACGQPLPAA